MGTCVIFCAAEFDRLVCPIGPEDWVIAADGGLEHTNKLHITPHRILGDFDSLGYVPEGAEVFPVEKDDTDAMLAAKQGLARGFREFLFYGSLDGPRLDHTVANFQTLQYLADHGAFGILAGNTWMAAVIREGTLRFPAGCSGTISVFCSGAEARGIDLEGLYYSLRDGSLSPGFPLGASNHFTGAEAAVTVRQGSLLVLWERQAVLPVRQALHKGGKL